MYCTVHNVPVYNIYIYIHFIPIALLHNFCFVLYKLCLCEHANVIHNNIFTHWWHYIEHSTVYQTYIYIYYTYYWILLLCENIIYVKATFDYLRMRMLSSSSASTNISIYTFSSQCYLFYSSHYYYYYYYYIHYLSPQEPQFCVSVCVCVWMNNLTYEWKQNKNKNDFRSEKITHTHIKNLFHSYSNKNINKKNNFIILSF